MEHATEKNILAMAICLLMIMPQVGFAEDGTQWGSTSTQTYNLEVPVGNVSQSTQSSQTDPSIVGQNPPPILENGSSISLPDNTSDGVPPELTEPEALQVLQLLSEALTMAESDTQLSASDAAAYKQANNVIKDFLESRKSPTYTPVGNNGRTPSKVLEDVGKILPVLPNTPALEDPSLPSWGWAWQFVNYIVASIRTTQEHMAEDASLPAAEIFSAGESPRMVREESVVLSRESNRSVQKDYQVVSSVVLSREVAKTHELLNPPQKLHPFIRWLLYGRHLTKVRAERYLAARAKVQAIFLRAKAGDGLIRYKGKIMGVFLPLPGDESGGAFELVRRM
jgi:hypothetical protein